MDAHIIENYRRYRDRVILFQKFGYDMVRERDFIIEKSQPLKGAILELGTGKGYFTVALAQKGYAFTTVDISKEEQEFARMNVQYLGLESKVNFVIGNAEQLRFDDGTYNSVFAINVIHHLDKPFEVSDELIRVAARGGKIVLSDFSKEGFELINQIHMSEGRRHSRGLHDLSDVGEYLAKKGYRLEKFKTACQEMLIIHKGNQ